jgi:Helix-turn-helix domain
MSNKLVRAVRDNRTITNPYDKWILSLLADHANDSSGLCCPSLITLSDESAMAKRSVMRSLNRLEQQGMIHREKGGGERHPTKYFFPGLENPDRDRVALSDNSQDRDGMPLSDSLHDGKNGSRADLQTGTVVHQDRDRVSPRQGPCGPLSRKKQKA